MPDPRNPFPTTCPIPGLPEGAKYPPVLGVSLNSGGATVVHGTGTAAAIDGAAGPYDFSDADDQELTVSFSEDAGGTYKQVTIANVADGAVDEAAVTATEVAAALNANAVFSALLVAANNAGALLITARLRTSRFKVFFGGAAAVVLGSEINAAVANGSAVLGDTTHAGSPHQIKVEDALGVACPFVDVIMASSLSGKIATVTKGQVVSGVRGSNSQTIKSDVNGLIAFYVTDQVAESTVVTAKVGTGVIPTLAGLSNTVVVS